MASLNKSRKKPLASKWIFILLVLCFGGIFGATGYSYTKYQDLQAELGPTAGIIHGSFASNPVSQAPEQQPAVIQENGAPPAATPGGARSYAGSRFIIPDLNINAKFIDVGLTKENAIDTPKSLWDVGWYNGSSYPGEAGSSMIVGHYSRFGKAVFAKLAKIKPGQKIVIKSADGKELKFVVIKIEDFKVEDLPVEKILNDKTSTPKIEIVTCSGQFVQNTRDFTNRTLVTAEIE